MDQYEIICNKFIDITGSYLLVKISEITNDEIYK